MISPTNSISLYKHRNVFLVCVFFLLSLSISNAQQDNNQLSLHKHEIGLQFTGFDDFNVMYKVSKKPNIYRRHRFLSTRISYNSNSKEYGGSFGYAFGIEKRRNLKDNLKLLTGPEFILVTSYRNFDNRSVDRNTQLDINPAIGFIIGLQLDVSDRVTIAAELIPRISATISRLSLGDNLFRLEAGINSNATALTVMYRI